MKRYLALLILFLFVFSANAQRVYLDKNGAKTSRVKEAVAYNVVKKLGDTAWSFQSYDMQDRLISSGVFRDADLKIPDGKFVYYYPFKHFKGKHAPAGADTVNHPQMSGEYKNGLKDGYWINYNMAGRRTSLQYYTKDVLDGPYRVYDELLNIVKTNGQYKDGEMVGKWLTLNQHGEVIRMDEYTDDHSKQSFKYASKYKEAIPTDDFYVFIEAAMRKWINSNDEGHITILCKVNLEGKLTEPELLGKSYDDRLEKKLFALIPSCPQWIPSINIQTHQHDVCMVTFTVTFKDSQVQATHITSAKQ